MSVKYLCNKIYSANCVTCINSENLDLIEQGIQEILDLEKLQQISKPLLPQDSKPLLQHLLSSPYQINNLLVIGLYPSNFGWTVIQTSKEDFFCRRAKNDTKPRLSILSKRINYDAFAYSFYNNFLGALLEANANGNIFVAGYLDNSDSREDADIFYREPVNLLSGGLCFNLLNVSKELQDISKQRDIDLEKRKEELEQLADLYPEKINYALSEYKKIASSAFVRADENLRQLLSCSESFWYGYHLLYNAYAKSEQLASERIKLLFFKPKNLGIEEIWSSITSRKDYREELWQDIPF